mmetsp:Transcript_68802/g.161867  ORF Transcript_68802/g.161867 Transcript_68802/m.161867 type:complete len:253 (-) Transcript_68802:230-988(-)
MRGVQQLPFLEVVADQLQAHGHAAVTAADRHAHAGQAGQRAGQREDVGQIRLGRVVLALAVLPGNGRGHRAGDQVTLREGLLEVVGDHAAQLLGLQVVGVVVAVREHIGADHDAALHLGAEALGARLLVHVEQVVVLGGAVAELDAIKPAQVGARLGRGNDVVHRNRQLGARQADVHQRGAELLQLGQAGAHRAVHVGRQRRGEELLRQADAQALERLRGRGAFAGRQHLGMKVLRRLVHAGRVALVEAAHG